MKFHTCILHNPKKTEFTGYQYVESPYATRIQKTGTRFELILKSFIKAFAVKLNLKVNSTLQDCKTREVSTKLFTIS